jgi:uncharacterized protein YdiU (UPF0061 family)
MSPPGISIDLPPPHAEIHRMFDFDNSYIKLPDALFAIQHPVSVKQPELCLFNAELAQSLGLDIPAEENLSELLSGNSIPPGTTPISQAYAGHQFGHFTNLGDGRAVLLGEHVAETGRVDIQFKGSGRTPYSRGGDGRASLGPMLREYIVSEAMHHLGVPTTRSLAVVKTGEAVHRQSVESGAILTRVASSHLRIGTFQYAAALDDSGLLATLLDYAIDRHYPHLAGSGNKALGFLEEVGRRQASLVSQWMKIGFIHGVMNTDNTSISGETIDYGPCAFMDEYDPDTVFSSIDVNGRYAYRNQLNIIHWNMARLAEALLPLLHEKQSGAIEMAGEFLARLEASINGEYLSAMSLKLGIADPKEDDRELIGDLLRWMHTNNLDFTNTFRALSQVRLPADGIYGDEEFKRWHRRWLKRIRANAPENVKEIMEKHNPAIIPRNHLVERVITAAEQEHDLSPLHRFLGALKDPFSSVPGREEYLKLPSESERVRQTFCGT